MFYSEIHDDQPERLAYGKALKKRFIELTNEKRKEGWTEEQLDKLFGENPESYVQDAIDKWGLPYAKRLYNMALQNLVIHEALYGIGTPYSDDEATLDELDLS